MAPDNNDKNNMIFSSTNVVSGKAHAVVVGTGARTQVGIMFATMVESRKEQEDEKTPLGEKIDEFGNQLTKAIGLICFLVWVMNARQFFNDEGSLDAGKVGRLWLWVCGSLSVCGWWVGGLVGGLWFVVCVLWWGLAALALCCAG